jgi:hypothetical protein
MAAFDSESGSDMPFAYRLTVEGDLWVAFCMRLQINIAAVGCLTRS